MEGRILGRIDLEGETSDENYKGSIKDDNDTDKNKMVIWGRSRKGVSKFDAPF